MNHKVSVIIPTYKSGDTLARAINSVLAQTYKDFEILVVDDNDPDSPARKTTESIIKKYENERKVLYFQHSQNKNGAAARNTAFNHSSGDYIAFLDDDDYFINEKLERQVAFLENNPEYGGCYCWRYQLGEKICGTYSGDLSYEILSLDFTPYTSCILIRRECYEKLNGFDESYYRHQDFEFLLRFFKFYKLGYIDYLGTVISENGVNNTPKGKKLVSIKEHFFNQFSDDIERITLGSKKQKEYIYCNHFVRTYKDLLRYGHPLLAFKIYVKYRFKCGLNFWPLFFKLICIGAKERLERII